MLVLLLLLKPIVNNAVVLGLFLKRLCFGSKECTKELKLEYVNFLGQTS